MTAPAIVATRVAKRFGRAAALREVSFEVPRGEPVAVLGANGAGKSTLLMTICGNPRASEGTIRFEGEDITRLATYDIVRHGIAQSPEGRRIFPFMSVLENLQMGAATVDPEHFD